MSTLLELIGLFVIIKFFIKNRRIFMDRKAFWEAAKDLRRNIASKRMMASDVNLDNIIEIVTGEPEVENLDEDLTQHIIRHIKQLKAKKEEKALEDKAKGILDQIKSALED